MDRTRGDTGVPLPNLVFVKSKAQLPAAVGGVITLADNITYFILSDVDLLGDRLVAGQNTTIIGGSSENCILRSTGLNAATPLLSSAWSLPIRNVAFTHDLVLDLDANGNANQALDWFGVNFVGCASVGTIANYTNFIMADSALLDSANLTFDGSFGTVGFSQCLFSGLANQTSIVLPATLTITRRFRIIYSAFVAFGGGTALNVSTSATIPVEGYILDTVNFSGGATYTAGVQFDDNKALFQNCRGISNSGEIGQMYMSANASATTIGGANVYVKVAGTTVAGGINQKFTHTTGRLTFTGAIARAFKITSVCSALASTGNKVSFRVAKNGTSLAESTTTATVSASNRFESLACQAIVSLATNDYIELFVANDNVTNVTVEDLNIVVEALN